MDCTEADILVSAKVDGEISPADQAVLDAHLATCAGCRATLEALSAQDADLQREFAPRREAGARVAEAAIRQIRREQYRPRHFGWVNTLVAAAAGFAIALLIFRPWSKISRGTETSGTETRTQLVSIGRLALATGAIEFQTPDAEQWQVMATGANVQPGSRVRTGKGVRCEFVMADGSTVRLNGNSELMLSAPRSLDLAKGQMWSTVNAANLPFVVAVAQATITGVDGQFDILAGPQQTTVTVLAGRTKVTGKTREATVDAGQRVQIVGGAPGEVTRAYDLLLSTRWINELLMLQGRDNVELHKRVDDLMAHVGEIKMGELYDEEIRALGDHCLVPLMRFIESPRSRTPGDSRQLERAAQIVGDLAVAWCIPDLIRMVPDSNATVRFNAVRALHRLTTAGVGYSADECRRDSARAQETYNSWRRWWDENKERYRGTGPLQGP